jgi:hypothetical protein
VRTSVAMPTSAALSSPRSSATSSRRVRINCGASLSVVTGSSVIVTVPPCVFGRGLRAAPEQIALMEGVGQGRWGVSVASGSGRVCLENAAIVIGRTGDVRGFPTAGHFARHNGTAPIEASSGPNKRHRTPTSLRR